KEKTDEFESLIIKTLLDVSMKDSNELFGKDAGDKIYQSMFREQISKSTAGGFGISEILFNFLKENR
ncbi:MAG TPA: Rod binding protein, partial [Campylobacterales bacterium]|nr:Rod binding protein [Campylobacterales bacterium]